MHLSYPILHPKSYKEKRDLLRQNFICCYRSREVQFPRNMAAWQRDVFLKDIPPLAIRATMGLTRSLYAGQSLLILNDTTLIIGQGLFSHLSYRKGELIATFNGEIISNEEALYRASINLGGYMIYATKTSTLDCRSNRFTYDCMASLANTPTNCKVWLDGNLKSATANCRITRDSGKNKIHLRSIKLINSGEEMLWKYGKSYIMRKIFNDTGDII